jgi:hypothetical protein
MNPIRRELLNGVFVLVLASLMSAAFAAFQVKFDVQLWVLILIGVGIAVTGYVMFEIALGYMASTEQREKEWLKRVGNPARLELGMTVATLGSAPIVEAVKSMRPGSDLTIMIYLSSQGSREAVLREAALDEGRKRLYEAIMEQLNRGTIREYKRLVCFDADVLVNDQDLKSGILRVGEGPGTISKAIGEHCRLMLATKGCSVYVAPVVLRSYVVGLFGTDKVSMTVDTVDQDTGIRSVAGVMFFYDPPNGEIVEQFRQIERATERRMVAVHKIRFPEDAAPSAQAATR